MSNCSHYSRNWMIAVLAPFLWVIQACQPGNEQPGKENKPYDTPKQGRIVISVDESFKPIIDSQLKVFKASFPETDIVAYYKAEAECLKDLEVDSVRMVIVTRGLSKEESEGFEQKINFKPSWGIIAYDAVAVVTNKNATKNTLSLKELRSMLDGSIGGDYEVVMDGTQATSTVRFAIDTLLKGKSLGSKVVAARSSEGVIDYIENSSNAIGLLGVSWVGNPEDEQQLSFQKRIQMVSMKCETCTEDAYVLPYQANIALGRYPLTRGIYYILKENYEGLGKGFVNFLIYERGQLIFKRAYILPGRMNFGVRQMEIKE